MDFQDIARDYSLADTGVLFVVANDQAHSSYFNAESSVLRAVENNFAVARVSQGEC